jgi:hypothetical protein
MIPTAREKKGFSVELGGKPKVIVPRPSVRRQTS